MQRHQVLRFRQIKSCLTSKPVEINQSVTLCLNCSGRVRSVNIRRSGLSLVVVELTELEFDQIAKSGNTGRM